MTILEFIASLVGSVAWPLVALVIAGLFRRQLAQILLKISRLKYGDVEIQFARELEKATEEAEKIDVRPSLPLHQTTDQRNTTSLLVEATQLSSIFPEPAVAVAWSAVEHELTQAVMRLAISPDYPPHNSALKSISLLREQGAIDEATVGLLDRMRRLRNIALHGAGASTSIPIDEAREFISLARGIIERLQQLRR